MRDSGLAVQDAVERTLRAAGLDVSVVDRGFDFEVFVQEQTPLRRSNEDRLTGARAAEVAEPTREAGAHRSEQTDDWQAVHGVADPQRRWKGRPVLRA